MINEKTRKARIVATPEELEAINILPPFNKLLSFKEVAVMEFSYVKNPFKQILNEDNASRVRVPHDKSTTYWAINNKFLEHVK